MRKSVITLFIMSLAVCASAQTHVQHDCCSPMTRQHKQVAEGCDSAIDHSDISPSTLIIFYSGKNKRVLKAARKIGAEVIYTYTSFNAIAVRKPDAWTLELTKVYFERIKGVMQVNYDRICHLDTLSEPLF